MPGHLHHVGSEALVDDAVLEGHGYAAVVHEVAEPGDHGSIVDAEVFSGYKKVGVAFFCHGVYHGAKPCVAGDAAAEKDLVFFGVCHGSFGDFGEGGKGGFLY